MKLGLGTVQLGLPYGVANKKGKPDREAAMEILKTACQNGMDSFDTAAGYGESEAIIGEFTERYRMHDNVKISSKTNYFSDKDHLKKDVMESITRSLEKLRVKKLDYYLLHSPAHLFDFGERLVDMFLEQVRDKKIGKFGVSVYTPQDVEECLKYQEIKVVQVPFNILDQRLLKTGLLQRLKERNVEVHARSVYLQGVINMELEDIPVSLCELKPYLSDLKKIAEKYSMTKKELAFFYVHNCSLIDKMFIGCETVEQVHENSRMIENFTGRPIPNDKELTAVFNTIPNDLLNPSLWRTA